MSSLNEEISEKVQKSLITSIKGRLHRLEYFEMKEKSVESVFEIPASGRQVSNQRARISFSELL